MGEGVAAALVPVLIQIIMFDMGTTRSLRDFARVVPMPIE